MNSRKDLFLPHKTFWAWHPERTGHEAGFTLFKRIVQCEREEEFHLALSADNRYTLFLDGKLLGRGPVRGSLDHYYYDEYSGNLAHGEHLFAVEVMVWNDAWRESPAPWSEMHAGGGLMTAGYVGEDRFELPGKWFTRKDTGRRPLSWKETWSSSLINPAPPLDEVNFNQYDSDWCRKMKITDEWQIPSLIGKAVFHGEYQDDPTTPWMLEPRPVLTMEQTFTPIAELRSSHRSFHLENGILHGSCPAGKYRMLLNLGRNQTSMIHFSGKGGKGFCRIAYAESFFNEEEERFKQPYGEIGQKGYSDHLILPPEENAWCYDSFWYRTGQFIELELDLKENLKEVEFRVDFITYGVRQWREFHAPHDPVLGKIYAVGCHTLRCCTHENYEDCPYYEQLQYAGDSRIHALVSYAATGDDSMAKQMLRAINHSRMNNGLTQSRYPSTFRQVIPGYSLIWILAVHDHYTHFKDPVFTGELLPGIESVLGAFEQHRLKNGLIATPEGWHFTDWTRDWPYGASDRGEFLPETILNLFYAEACRCTAELREAMGQNSSELKEQRENILKLVNSLCYDPEKNRYQDVPGKDWFSLHCNILAILFGAVPKDRCAAFLQEILEDETLTQPTLYFEFYVLSAIRRYGSAADFRKRLAPWEKMLDAGYSTFPEKPAQFFRSECHAWSAAPVWFLCDEKKHEPMK